MKQIIIGKKKTYATTPSTLTDATAVPEGVIGMYNLSDNKLITTKLTENFCIVLGRGAGKAPIFFPEVDVKSLTVEKSTAVAGKTFKGTITINSVTPGKDYTIIVVKKGVVRHERNTWTATAAGSTVASVVDSLVKQFNASSETSGITASKSGGAITITAINAGEPYDIVGADELTGVAVTSKTDGIPATLDKAYVQDLASRCAAGKGFNLTALEGRDIYPGYPEAVEDTNYTMFTLRFAVPRVAAKQRDEVVYQLVHIVVPDGSGVITTLDTIFGTGASASQASA